MVDYGRFVKKQIRSFLHNYDASVAKEVEGRIDRKAINRYIERSKRSNNPLTRDDDRIEEYIQERLELGSRKGCVGEFYHQGGRFKRLIKKRRSTGALYTITHPTKWLKPLIEKIFGPGPDYVQKGGDAVEDLRDVLNDPSVEPEARERAEELSKLGRYRKATELLERAKLIKGYTARSVGHRLERKAKKEVRGLVGIIRRETMAILIILAGAVTLGLSVNNYSFTGYVVADTGVYVSNLAIIGMTMIVVGFIIWRHALKKEK